MSNIFLSFSCLCIVCTIVNICFCWYLICSALSLCVNYFAPMNSLYLLFCVLAHVRAVKKFIWRNGLNPEYKKRL